MVDKWRAIAAEFEKDRIKSENEKVQNSEWTNLSLSLSVGRPDSISPRHRGHMQPSSGLGLRSFQVDTGDSHLQSTPLSSKKGSVSHEKKPRKECQSSFSPITQGAEQQSYRRASLAEGHKQRLTTTRPNSIESVRTIHDNEANTSLTVATTNSTEETIVQNKGLRLLLVKTLTRSDIELGRIVFPKLAERNFPYLNEGKTMCIEIEDPDGAGTWKFNYRHLPNTKCRMYVFENTREFAKRHGLVKGDKINVYKDLETKAYVIRVEKTGHRARVSSNTIIPSTPISPLKNKSRRASDLEEGRKQRPTTKRPNSTEPVLRIQKNEANTSRTVSTSNATAEETGVENKGLVLLLAKTLSLSDVGSVGRIVLPKLDAESNLPYLEQGQSMCLELQDFSADRTWKFNYEAWANNTTRMYLFKNTREFSKFHDLVKGDKINVYKDLETKTLVIGVESIGHRARVRSNDHIPSTPTAQLKHTSK